MARRNPRLTDRPHNYARWSDDQLLYAFAGYGGDKKEALKELRGRGYTLPELEATVEAWDRWMREEAAQRNPRRARSTGFVAAKIRANTARRNGLPAQKKDKYKKYLTSRDAPNVGGVGRRKLKRLEEKATRQKGKYQLREELAPMDQAQMDAALAAEALEAQMERVAAQEARHSHIESEWGTWEDLDYASERARRKMAEASGAPYLSKKERAKYEKSRKGQQERDAWRRREEERARAKEKAYFVEEAAWDSQDQPSVAVGLRKGKRPEGPDKIPVSGAHQLDKQLAKLHALFVGGQIDEPTYLRLRRSFRYERSPQKRRGIGAELDRLEREAADRPTARSGKRSLAPWQVQQARLSIEEDLKFGDRLAVEAATDGLKDFAALRKSYGVKGRMAWEKQAWKKVSALKARTTRGPRPSLPDFSPDYPWGPPNVPEIAMLYESQVKDMQAPTISREEARSPDDPFADFMFHEGADEFFKENPRRARRNGGVLERSSHSYAQWVPYLNRGISPHNNPVHIIEVGQGRTGRVPQGVKAYYAGNVRAEGTSFTLGRGGLVIVNTKPNRVVFITP